MLPFLTSILCAIGRALRVFVTWVWPSADSEPEMTEADWERRQADEAW